MAGARKSLATYLKLALFGISILSTLAFARAGIVAPNADEIRTADLEQVEENSNRRLDEMRDGYARRRETIRGEMAKERADGIGPRYKALSEQLEGLNAEERREITRLEEARDKQVEQTQANDYLADHRAGNTYINALTSMFSFLGTQASTFLISMVFSLLMATILEGIIYTLFMKIRLSLLAPDEIPDYVGDGIPGDPDDQLVPLMHAAQHIP